MRATLALCTVAALVSAAAADPPDTLNREDISIGIGKIKGAVAQCGDKSRSKGTVKIAATVDPKGHITNVTVKATPDAALGSCVAAAVQKATFRETTKSTSFLYPFVF